MTEPKPWKINPHGDTSEQYNEQHMENVYMVTRAIMGFLNYNRIPEQLQRDAMLSAFITIMETDTDQDKEQCIMNLQAVIDTMRDDMSDCSKKLEHAMILRFMSTQYNDDPGNSIYSLVACVNGETYTAMAKKEPTRPFKEQLKLIRPLVTQLVEKIVAKLP